MTRTLIESTFKAAARRPRFFQGPATLCLLVAAAYVSGARAQHATAYDIEGGGRAYESYCAACHGPDGNLIEGIDFSRGLFRRPLSDADIVGIIVNGIPNTPMPPTPGMSAEQAERVVAYLRSMPEAFSRAAAGGDAVRGREIVMGSGGCLDCHRIEDRGSRLGPDLRRIGLERRADELERSLVEPDAEVMPANRFVEVVPKRGEPVTGRLLNHDSFTVQLLDERERLRSFDRAELDGFEFVVSPMPSFADELDAQALADVVSYLTTLRGVTTP